MLEHENAELRKLLEKARYDCDYWKDKYDLMLKNLNSQYEYIRYLESQVFNNSAK
jgi:hypothetical protein